MKSIAWDVEEIRETTYVADEKHASLYLLVLIFQSKSRYFDAMHSCKLSKAAKSSKTVRLAMFTFEVYTPLISFPY